MILGTANKGRFGSAIANLGDINSDGFEGLVQFTSLAPTVCEYTESSGSVSEHVCVVYRYSSQCTI